MVAATSQVRPGESKSRHPWRNLRLDLLGVDFFFPIFQQISKNGSMIFPEFRHLRVFGWGSLGFLALFHVPLQSKLPTAIGEATRCSGAQRGLRYKKSGRMGVFFLEKSVFSWLDKNLDPTYYSIFLSRVGGFVN